MVGRALKSSVRRFSVGSAPDNENSPLGVSRLRTLLKRKTKKAETTAGSVTTKKVRPPKPDAWVNLKDGTTIKLCSSCATKKNNLTADSQKIKDKPKATKKVNVHVDENKNKRTLRGTKNKNIESEMKSIPDTKEKSITQKKETAAKATKPKETKKTKKDVSSTKSSASSKEKKETVDPDSKTPAKIKRAPKKTSNTENDTTKETKKTNTRANTTGKNSSTAVKNKTPKTTRVTSTKKKIIVKLPKSKNTDKNGSKNKAKSELDEMNVTDLVDTSSEKKQKRSIIKSEKTKRAVRTKPNVSFSMSPDKSSDTKRKSSNLKVPKMTKTSKISKMNKKFENNSDNNNESDTNEKSDNASENQSEKPKTVRKRPTVIVETVKSKIPVKKLVEVKASRKKSMPRMSLKSKAIKPEKVNYLQPIINPNCNDDSINNSMEPDIGIHSTLIEDNINPNESYTVNENLKSNKNLVRPEIVTIKKEPIDEYYATSPNEYTFSDFENRFSLPNDSELTKLKSNDKLTKQERLLHVTFRNKSMELKPKSAKKLKEKKYEKDKEARKRFKNDKKVAKAMVQMSKYFAKFQVGSVGELPVSSSFSEVSSISSSEEDSSSGSCHCGSYDSRCSNTSCSLCGTQMQESTSSSWVGSCSKYTDDSYITDSSSTESSVFEGSEKSPNKEKNSDKTYDLRNRDA